MTNQEKYLKIYVNSFDKSIYELSDTEKTARYYVEHDNDLSDIVSKIKSANNKKERLKVFEKYVLDKNNIIYSENNNLSVFDTKEEETSIMKEIKLEEEMVLCFINKGTSEVISNIKKYTESLDKLDNDLKSGRINQSEYDFYKMMSTRYANSLNKRMVKRLKLQKNMGNNGFVNLIFISVLVMVLALILFLL
ncbi:MAG: hypothetical protein IIZ40_04510 [Bacilli bacterium]|nr:hypothetical protein [Bacilli bacterium]